MNDGCEHNDQGIDFSTLLRAKLPQTVDKPGYTGG